MNTVSRNITLCGIKHAGKSATGRALASMTGLPLCDTDDALAKLDSLRNHLPYVRSVRAIYRELGEDAFRKLEADAVREAASAPEKKILTLGGGVLSNPYVTEDDVALLGCICFLDVPDLVAFKRILRKGLPPFLFHEADPLRVFTESNQKRREIFAKYAEITIHTGGPHDTPLTNAQKILAA